MRSVRPIASVALVMSARLGSVSREIAWQIKIAKMASSVSPTSARRVLSMAIVIRGKFVQVGFARLVLAYPMPIAPVVRFASLISALLVL